MKKRISSFIFLFWKILAAKSNLKLTDTSSSSCDCGLGSNIKVIHGHSAHERKLQMCVRVDSTRHHESVFCINDAYASGNRRSYEMMTNSFNFSMRNQNICLPLTIQNFKNKFSAYNMPSEYTNRSSLTIVPFTIRIFSVACKIM